MVASLARRPWQIAGLIACLLLAPAAEAVVGLAQFLTGDGPPSFRIAPDAALRARLRHDRPAELLRRLHEMAWPLALAQLFGFWILRFWIDERQSQNPKSATPIAANLKIFSGFLVLGSWSRCCSWPPWRPRSRAARWVGAACGVVGMALALGPRARRWALAALGLGALALALGGAGLLPDVLAARLASITRYLTIFDAGTVAVTPQNFAVVERMAQMQAGWRMFLAHPLTGVGPGNYTLAYPAFAVGTWYASRGHAHNYYIHMAAETGVIGAAGLPGAAGRRVSPGNSHICAARIGLSGVAPRSDVVVSLRRSLGTICSRICTS